MEKEKNELSELFDKATPKQKKAMIGHLVARAQEKMDNPYAELVKHNRKILYTWIATIAAAKSAGLTPAANCS